MGNFHTELDSCFCCFSVFRSSLQLHYQIMLGIGLHLIEALESSVREKRTWVTSSSPWSLSLACHAHLMTGNYCVMTVIQAFNRHCFVNRLIFFPKSHYLLTLNIFPPKKKKKKKTANGFGTSWWWENNDIIFLFGYLTIPLEIETHIKCSFNNSFPLQFSVLN